MRLFLLALLVALAALAQGCATQDPAARAAQQVALESEDDELCQKRGAPDSETYESCRKEREETRARAAVIQEQKRRDFDRVLGAGTHGQADF